MPTTVDPAAIAAIAGATHGAPFDILGQHQVTVDGKSALAIRAFQPRAASLMVQRGQTLHPMTPAEDEPGFYEAIFPNETNYSPYQLQVTLPDGKTHMQEDPYRFGPVLSEYDLYLFGEGKHYELYEKLGAHVIVHEGATGVVFAVWAPSAERVSVVGDFQPVGRTAGARCGPRWRQRAVGIVSAWAGPGRSVQIRSQSRYAGYLGVKSDPYGFAMEVRPGTASIVWDLSRYEWHDEDWLAARPKRQALDAAMTVYEVHLGSWQRVGPEGNRWLTYRELAERLVPYARDLGYTIWNCCPLPNIRLMVRGATRCWVISRRRSRFGTPDDFRYFVDTAHQAGLGIILDWVPAHFPKDAAGLAYFDGTHLYEHADPRRGEHQDWGTLIFNFGRNEVSAFLLTQCPVSGSTSITSTACAWTPVASMLYLDYSRKAGEWLPNEFGGREIWKPCAS